MHVAGGVVLPPRIPPPRSRDRSRRSKGRNRSLRSSQRTHRSEAEAARRDDVSSGAGTRRGV